MFELGRAKRANRYIFFEMLPTFLLGVVIFLFVILMFQSFRLTEYIIVHGASSALIAQILVYLSISFLPVILPMSLLFAVLLTYGRLSGDSEIVALKALGLNMYHLGLPAVILSAFVALISLQTSYYVAPWGNRQMEILVHKLGQSKPSVTIREGVFSEGFFDMVVYANEIDEQNDILKKVFIYDERSPTTPLTIIASQGRLIYESNMSGQQAFLRLSEGNIHRNQDGFYTKVDFETYDINLVNNTRFTEKKKTPLSYNLRDIRTSLANETLAPKMRTSLEIEFHRRTALAMLCMIFALIGVALGTMSNRRSGKSNGFVLCVSIVVLYWVVYAGLENLAKSSDVPVWLCVWLANVLFLGFGIYKLKDART